MRTNGNRPLFNCDSQLPAFTLKRATVSDVEIIIGKAQLSSTNFLSEDFLSAYQIPNGAPDVCTKEVSTGSMGMELARLPPQAVCDTPCFLSVCVLGKLRALMLQSKHFVEFLRHQF